MKDFKKSDFFDEDVPAEKSSEEQAKPDMLIEQDENADDDVTFRVTMDEKQMEQRLYGQAGKVP